MNELFDFEKLKSEIEALPFKKQLVRLIEAKSEFLQHTPKWCNMNLSEVSFDEKCDLEIKKIKDIKALNKLSLQ